MGFVLRASVNFRDDVVEGLMEVKYFGGHGDFWWPPSHG